MNMEADEASALEAVTGQRLVKTHQTGKLSARCSEFSSV
jgi:hypothetical protein